MAYTVKNIKLREVPGSPGNIYATWSFTKPANFDKYTVEWSYKTSSSSTVIHQISSSDTKTAYSTCAFPENAYRLRCRVKPVSKTKTSKSVTTSYWQGAYTLQYIDKTALLPSKPSAPSVAYANGKLIMSLTGITDTNTKSVRFCIYRCKKAAGSSNINDYVLYDTINAKVYDRQVSTKYEKLSSGHRFMIRCRGVNGDKLGPWSDDVGPFASIPSAVKIDKLRVVQLSDDNLTKYLYINWINPTYDTARTWQIQYTTNLNYFNSSEAVQSITTGDRTTDIVDSSYQIPVSNLQEGTTYYFRVRAQNDQGNSAWSEIRYITYGETPSPPTTFSNKLIAKSNEEVYLYWTHNSRDGSFETQTEIEYVVDGLLWSHTSFELVYGDCTKAETIYSDIDDFTIKFLPNWHSNKNTIESFLKSKIEKVTTYNNGIKIQTVPFEIRNSDLSPTEALDIFMDYGLIGNSAGYSSDGIKKGKTFENLIFALSDIYSLNIESASNPIVITSPFFAYTYLVTPQLSTNESLWKEDGWTKTQSLWCTKRNAFNQISSRFIIKSPDDYSTVSEYGLELCPPSYYTKPEDLSKQKYLKILADTYPNGATIKWRVRTAGITGNFGDDSWSIERTVNIYPQPNLTLELLDYDGETPLTEEDYQITTLNEDGTTSIQTISSEYPIVKQFPFYIKGQSNATTTQTPIGYSVSVISNDEYYYTTLLGEEGYVAAGQSVYSEYFNSKEELLYELNASMINLEQDHTYTIKVIMTMNTGLTAEQTLMFTVGWDENLVGETNAEIIYDPVSYACSIWPYLRRPNYEYDEDGEPIKEYLYDEDGNPLLDPGGEQLFDYVIDENEPYIFDSNVNMAVYRIDIDGRFTKIADEIQNGIPMYVTDPHPSLDFARYRIIATNILSGYSIYGDVFYETGCSSVIIQWDEEWSYLTEEVAESNDETNFTYSGQLLELPFNIDISNDYNPDVALANYIGRTEPVSYYGTQLGSTSTWNVEIPKTENYITDDGRLVNAYETITKLRKLAIYMGDVYVREPSGSGYWANVNVSFSQNHTELVVPITLNITRVDGGA